MKRQGEKARLLRDHFSSDDQPKIFFPGLRESVGEGMMAGYSEGVGLDETGMGEEGDFKQRAQPNIESLKGIEFETGM